MGKIFVNLLRPLFVILSSFIPKDKKVWVFGAWFGKRFSDNSKYFFKYINDNKKSEINAIWICKSEELLNQMRKDGYTAYSYKSLRGIWYQLRCSVCFVTHSISADLNASCISLQSRRVQLWHGVPLKKIVYDNNKESGKWVSSSFYKLFTNNFYSSIISPLEEFNKIFSSAFKVPSERVKALGYPRNDVFYRLSGDLERKVYRVIYMPTFRAIDGELLFSDKYKFNFDEIDSLLNAHNIELWLRVHPANLPPPELMNKIRRSKGNIKFSSVEDIYEEINSYDCLITDYSSVMFDFSITNKPIIFAAFDLEKYLSDERGMYFSYSEITDNDYAKDWQEAIDLLIEYHRKENNIYCSPLLNKISVEMKPHVSYQFSHNLFEYLQRVEHKRT